MRGPPRRLPARQARRRKCYDGFVAVPFSTLPAVEVKLDLAIVIVGHVAGAWYALSHATQSPTAT